LAAKHADEQIVLPGATSAEGIAKGAGATFYAGDLLSGHGVARHGVDEA